MRTIEVPADLAGQRLDNFLQRELKGLPKSRIYRLLRKGEIRVNKGRVKPDYRVCAGDLIRLPPMRLSERQGQSPGPGLARELRRRILYEDSDLLVIDKPSGLAVHGGSGVKLGLIEAMRELSADYQRLELVHRLDRETSGCILLARRRAALRALHRQFREHTVDKRYLALAHGQWPGELKQVSAPLLRCTSAEGERVVRVASAGQEALTRFAVLRRLPGATLVEARPVTGRTHQIRAHALHAGHPLFGDDRYGDREQNLADRRQGLKRLFLHAGSLSFTAMNKERVTVEAALDKNLVNFLEKLDN